MNQFYLIKGEKHTKAVLYVSSTNIVNRRTCSFIQYEW